VMGAGRISVYASIKELRSRECVALCSSLVIPTILCRIVGCFRVFPLMTLVLRSSLGLKKRIWLLDLHLQSLTEKSHSFSPC
jgi:hypothetical protein